MKTTKVYIATMVILSCIIITLSILLAGCNTDADLASTNLSTAAEQFKIKRRIVFYNGITDAYILSVEGNCSVEFLPYKSEVTCKIGPNEYVKHYLSKADNVFLFVEQVEAAEVSTYQYKVMFKPTSIVPDIDLN